MHPTFPNRDLVLLVNYPIVLCCARVDTRHMEVALLDMHACSNTRIVYYYEKLDHIPSSCILLYARYICYFLGFKQNGHIDYPMQYE